MTRWTIDRPATLDFDGVVALRVRVVSGSVAVLASDERPRVDITELCGQPLLVTHEAGILTITYSDLTWDGLLGWLRPQRHQATVTVTVPGDCPTQLGTVNASATMSGITASASIKSVSGDVTLDGVTGNLDANTVSGNLEAQQAGGKITFKTVSGELLLAGGSLAALDAKTVNGRVAADVGLQPGAGMRITTVSGEVAVRLPASADATVQLKSASGRVESGFGDVTCTRSAGTTTATGTLGTGGGSVSVATVSGPITLLKRPAQGDGHANDAASTGHDPTTPDARRRDDAQPDDERSWAQQGEGEV